MLQTIQEEGYEYKFFPPHEYRSSPPPPPHLKHWEPVHRSCSEELERPCDHANIPFRMLRASFAARLTYVADPGASTPPDRGNPSNRLVLSSA